MADTLDDIRESAQQLGLDVDQAVAQLDQLEATAASLESQLASAGVDSEARNQIVTIIRQQSEKIRSALDPSVPPVADSGGSVPPEEVVTAPEG